MEGSTTPDLLASDAERERTAEILRYALSEGRLDTEEFERRLHAVYKVRWRSELGPLTADVSTESASLVPGSADLLTSVSRLDRAIKERRESDVRLVNWWLYFLLLSWATFYIYSLYLFFKRIARIDAFSRRKRAAYDALLEWTERQASSRAAGGSVSRELADLKGRVETAYARDLRPIRAGLSFVLTLVTLGLYSLYVVYRMNRYWWDAQVLEEDFDDSLSEVWMRLGLTRYPITYRPDQSKRRSYVLYLVLSIVTFGIWALVWDYKLHTDPDNLFGGFHDVEDAQLQTVRSQ